MEEIEKFKEKIIERTLQILRDIDSEVAEDVCSDLNVDYILDRWEIQED